MFAMRLAAVYEIWHFDFQFLKFDVSSNKFKIFYIKTKTMFFTFLETCSHLSLFWIRWSGIKIAREKRARRLPMKGASGRMQENAHCVSQGRTRQKNRANEVSLII